MLRYLSQTSMSDLLAVGPKYTRPACRATAPAINGYLLPAPELSSKPAGRRRCCCRSTGQTDARTDTGPFYDAYANHVTIDTTQSP